MRSVEVGGLRTSVIGLGTWQFGSRTWGYGESYAGQDAFFIVEEALEMGINLFDTAEIYGFGASERILGQALGPRKHDVLLASKFFPVVPTASSARNHARRSLARLGVDTIDLYQLHFPNPVRSIESQVRAFLPLVHAGEIRWLGVSNYSLAAWQRAEAAVDVPIVSNQVNFSLVVRKAAREMIPWASLHDRLVIAWSPLEQGLLTGKYGPGHRPRGLLRRYSPDFSDRALLRLEPVLEVLERVARSHDATVSQVALAWVISHPNVVAIPGASSVAQVRANAAAADLELTEDEVMDLTEVASRSWPERG
jgi:aryl-alcohol dehydrogenase-like predicted oxidoreductase